MSELTLRQRFGSSAIAFKDEGEIFLYLNLTNLQDSASGGDLTNGLGLNISNITVANIDEYASKIFWALMLLAQQNQPENNIDEEVGIYISNQGKRPVTRNGVAQIGYQMLATGYKDDTDGLTLDPDSIGSQLGGNI